MPEDPFPLRSASPPVLTPLWPALPLTAGLLALYYYWFAIADRCAIFLYNHVAAQPFDAR